MDEAELLSNREDQQYQRLRVQQQSREAAIKQVQDALCRLGVVGLLNVVADQIKALAGDAGGDEPNQTLARLDWTTASLLEGIADLYPEYRVINGKVDILPKS